MKRLPSIPAPLSSDFAYCREKVLMHGGPMPLDTRFLPRRFKAYWFVLCAFVWVMRDVTLQGNGDDDLKLQLIDDWSRRLEMARNGQADHPVTRAMAHL
ncbi:MAG: hypothetical protein HQM00_01195, partial [Magnetococcales bacterium]|nr:hypothetical protein [Magnetococcales bacterium]